MGLLTRECWRRGSLLRTAWAGPGPRIAEDWADTDTGGPAQHQTGTGSGIVLASHVIIWPDGVTLILFGQFGHQDEVKPKVDTRACRLF